MQDKSQPATAPDSAPFNEKRILIMDDDEDVLLITSLLLNKKGYGTATAADGGEALERYKESLEAGNPFHLVISDLTVGEGVGGLELLAELQQVEPDVKVLLMTGYTDDPGLRNLDNSGFAGFLQKPFNKTKLFEAVEQAFE